MLVLKGIFGGSPKITLQNGNNPKVKNNPKRFLGYDVLNYDSLWRFRIANPPASYRSLSGPPGPTSQKSLKKVSQGLRLQGPK